MTDWNKEFDLLTEYLSYRVEWYTRHLLFGHRLVLNYFGEGVDFTSEFLIKTYNETGVLYQSNVPNKEENIGCMSFELWKENQVKL